MEQIWDQLTISREQEWLLRILWIFCCFSLPEQRHSDQSCQFESQLLSEFASCWECRSHELWNTTYNRTDWWRDGTKTLTRFGHYGKRLSWELGWVCKTNRHSDQGCQFESQLLSEVASCWECRSHELWNTTYNRTDWWRDGTKTLTRFGHYGKRLSWELRWMCRTNLHGLQHQFAPKYWRYTILFDVWSPGKTARWVYVWGAGKGGGATVIVWCWP